MRIAHRNEVAAFQLGRSTAAPLPMTGRMILCKTYMASRTGDFMLESADQNLIIWQYALNASWVLLPLVPAVLIYLIFPKSQTSLKGPFAGLTIRSSGAFAGYFLVLLATYPLLNRLNNNLEATLKPTWEIAGTIQLEDENGNRMNFDNRNSPLRIELDPELVSPEGRSGFRLRVPEIGDKVPSIYVRYPGFATYLLDPFNAEAGDNVKIDHARREIRITSPIIIRRQPCQGTTCEGP